MRSNCVRFFGSFLVLMASSVSAQNTFPATGNVGIGTTTTTALVTVLGPNLGATAGNSAVLMSLQDILPNHSYLIFTEYRTSNANTWETSTTRIQQVIDTTAQGYIDFNPVNGLYGMAFGTGTSEILRLSSNGNFGIGTTAPGARLEINGGVKLTAGSGASMTFQDGSVQSVAWNGVLSGGDYAESVDVSGPRTDYEPGDVLVVDPNLDGRFVKSSEPYATTVMGIYSTRPGVVGRRQKSDRSHMAEEVPMSMIGVVPTKVTTEGGPIKRGDLLVTSSRPGYAMKGTDHSQMLGAIIGKALEPLDAGTGVIEVAVSIQ